MDIRISVPEPVPPGSVWEQDHPSQEDDPGSREAQHWHEGQEEGGVPEDSEDWPVPRVEKECEL